MQTNQIRVNTQSSIRISGSKTIYSDPYLIEEASHDADVICITHDHFDHLDADSINNVKRDDTVFYIPTGIADQLKAIVGDADVRSVKPGESYDGDGYSIATVPAYNTNKDFHPKAAGFVGYLITLDGITYYAAGDTDALDELRDVKCDIAMVPIGGTYTMTVEEAAPLVNAIAPKIAIPIHYGSIVGKKEDADTFKNLIDSSIEVVTKLSF